MREVKERFADLGLLPTSSSYKPIKTDYRLSHPTHINKVEPSADPEKENNSAA
jgi:hypothetical protein